MTTRNERRKAAQARLLLKSERIAKAEIARQRQEQDKLIRANLSARAVPDKKVTTLIGKAGGLTFKEVAVIKGSTPRNFFSSSVLGNLKGRTHYGSDHAEMAAAGSMSSRSVQAVMMKKANRPERRYAEPKTGDRHSWPVIDKSSSED